MNTTISIPQSSPKANYLAHKAEIDASIAHVLDTGRYILGEEVTVFEQEFASYIGVSHGIGVGSGTEALHLALRACGIGSGDAVLTVSHTAVATIAAIEIAGATPVLVDIDPRTFTMNPNRLEDTIKAHCSGRLKAIIPVHLYGHPADMPAIMNIATRYGLFVIEDCAQSCGSEIQGRKTGTWGHLSAFSFYPTKNLGAFGDGGMVVTDNAEFADKVRMLREYGWRPRYVSVSPGINSRLDELQAAILRVKLRHLDEDNARRIRLAGLYFQMLFSTHLVLPEVIDGAKHVYHLFVIRSAKRDALQVALNTQGIGTLIHYPVPVHLQPAYSGRVVVSGQLHYSESVAREVLSLPFYPELPDNTVKIVSEAIRHIQRKGDKT